MQVRQEDILCFKNSFGFLDLRFSMIHEGSQQLSNHKKYHISYSEIENIY